MSSINEKSYDRIARLFSSSRSGSKVPDLLEELSQSLYAGDLVLDVGCGGGVPITAFLFRKGFQITGIDISTELLNLAKQAVPQAAFIKCDIMEYQTELVFNGIVAWDSLFHLQSEEHEVVFRRLYELLKPGGYLLFTHGGSEGQISGEMYGQPFWYSSLGSEKTRMIVKQLGFDILRWEVDNSEPNGYMKALIRKK